MITRLSKSGAGLISMWLFWGLIGVTQAASRCPEHYPGGVPPVVTYGSFQRGFVELCAPNGGFATGYSKEFRFPMFSVERLTAEHVAAHDGRARVNSFRPDDRLRRNERAELEDFKKPSWQVIDGRRVLVKFDRGHLAPDADSWDDATEADTYVLSNMIPQAARNNRGLHAHIESEVRHFAKKVGLVYVFTGGLFTKRPIQFMNDRIPVPDFIFKLVYLPSRNEAAAYLESNSDGADGQEYKEITLEQLNVLAGVNFLPSVQNVGVLKLPRPTGKGVIGE